MCVWCVRARVCVVCVRVCVCVSYCKQTVFRCNSQLMLCREIIAVCSEIHPKHILHCGQNTQLQNVKAGGT